MDQPPVSATQLARDVENLGTKASDEPTKKNLAQVGEELERAIGRAGDIAHDARVQEALGKAYGELGDYDRAVESYRRCLDDPGGSGRLKSAEQLANFEVRRAVQLCRDEGQSLTDAEVKQHLDAAKNRLEGLEAYFGVTAERSALLGSFHKKRASIAPRDERAADITASRDHYRAAWEKSSKGRDHQHPYHTLVWAQLAKLASKSGSSSASSAVAEIHIQLHGEAKRPDQDYWQVAALGDLALTEAILRQDGRDKHLREAGESYIAAFELRSSVRQRDSAIDHLKDLAELFDGDLSEALDALAEDLASWKSN